MTLIDKRGMLKSKSGFARECRVGCAVLLTRCLYARLSQVTSSSDVSGKLAIPSKLLLGSVLVS